LSARVVRCKSSTPYFLAIFPIALICSGFIIRRDAEPDGAEVGIAAL